MGTKIQANAFFRDYHPVIDLDGSTSTGLRSLYHENQIVKNGHNPNSLTSHKNGYLGYDTDKVRQKILEHESIFRNQLQELHRLYRRQEQLMSEIKRTEITKDGARQDISKSSSLSYLTNMEKSMQERFSKLPVFETTSQNCNYQSPYDRDANSRFGFHLNNTNNQSYLSISNPTNGLSANPCSNLNLVTKDFMQDFCSDEPRKENVNCPSLSRRKRKIFGVEIFEGNDDTFEATNMSSTKWSKGCSSESQTKQDNAVRGLPWFLKNSQYSTESSNVTKSSYFMNMDSLQNCSENFFSKHKKEISPINEVIVNDGTSGKKILGFPISDMLKDLNSGDDLPKVNSSTINVNIDLRHHIDLNLTLTLDEEDVTLAPSVPTTIVKISTTEIDLEAPLVIEHEADILPKKVNSIVPHEEEFDKIAAEAIIAMSISRDKNLVDEPRDSISTDRLKWLAEIISSQCDDDKEEFVPSGMDYFEFMTLKLEDTKEKSYLYKPVILPSPSDDEAGSAKLPKRSRRGRQKKDFQRDILPGMVTLSRHEVTEDFQAFDAMLEGDGNTGQSGLLSRRKGRGRKRLGGTTTKAQCTIPKKKKPVCQHEERSLSGWGKRTRRLPRQRCTNSFLYFPVKC